MSRCTGHCCKVFFLPFTLEEMQENARAQRAGKIPDKNGNGWLLDMVQVAEMVIPLGRRPDELFRPEVLTGMPLHPKAGDHAYYFTCRNLLPSGDCAIYETRPQMCRGFPYKEPCPMVGCTMTEDCEQRRG